MDRNAELLLKAAERIEAIPESYYQGAFCEPSSEAPCGTAGCLAGEIIICSEPTVEEGIAKLKAIVDATEIDPDAPWPGDIAGDLVGFTPGEKHDLFATTDADTWPERFSVQYEKAKTDKERARAAVNLLRYLAKDGEVA